MSLTKEKSQGNPSPQVSFSEQFSQTCKNNNFNDDEARKLFETLVGYTNRLYEFLPSDCDWTDAEISTAYSKMGAKPIEQLVAGIIAERSK